VSNSIVFKVSGLYIYQINTWLWCCYW